MPARRVEQRVPAGGQLLRAAGFVRVALVLDRRARALEPRLPDARPARRRRATRESRRAPRSARTLPRGATAEPCSAPPRASPAASPSSCSRYSTRATGCLQRPVRVVQVRRALEARAPFGRRRVVEVVRVKLAAERRGTAARAPRDRGSACAAGRGTRSSRRGGRATGSSCTAGRSARRPARRRRNCGRPGCVGAGDEEDIERFTVHGSRFTAQGPGPRLRTLNREL